MGPCRNDDGSSERPGHPFRKIKGHKIITFSTKPSLISCPTDTGEGKVPTLDFSLLSNAFCTALWTNGLGEVYYMKIKSLLFLQYE